VLVTSVGVRAKPSAGQPQPIRASVGSLRLSGPGFLGQNPLTQPSSKLAVITSPQGPQKHLNHFASTVRDRSPAACARCPIFKGQVLLGRSRRHLETHLDDRHRDLDDLDIAAIGHQVRPQLRSEHDAPVGYGEGPGFADRPLNAMSLEGWFVCVAI